ncbi:hypothetical protein [Peterkaempfera griseoplana]|uniref:hypothetical protein n=1 Tax=Peterkaempfera griseoplana TaxID=66896 RepID=UPI000A99A6C7|nr:hypothetical protein [Peterkaempfera griseoplana]
MEVLAHTLLTAFSCAGSTRPIPLVIADLAELYSVSRATVHRVLERVRSGSRGDREANV